MKNLRILQLCLIRVEAPDDGSLSIQILTLKLEIVECEQSTGVIDPEQVRVEDVAVEEPAQTLDDCVHGICVLVETFETVRIVNVWSLRPPLPCQIEYCEMLACDEAIEVRGLLLRFEAARLAAFNQLGLCC